MAMWMCAIFALVCFSVAGTGFFAIGEMTDASERELSAGYAWFWAFLGAVASVFGVLSWMMTTGRLGKED